MLGQKLDLMKLHTANSCTLWQPGDIPVLYCPRQKVGIFTF